MKFIANYKCGSACLQLLLILPIMIGAVVIAGCRDPSGTSGSYSNVRSVTPAQTFDFQQLVGQWQGIAYQNDLGVFMPAKPLSFDPVNRSRPKEVEARATVEFVIEVEEKYLQIKGVEACYITLIHKTLHGHELRSRDMYRIRTKDDVVTLVGRGGTFEMEAFKVDSFLLKGEFRDVAGELIRNSVQVRLYRIDNAFIP